MKNFQYLMRLVAFVCMVALGLPVALAQGDVPAEGVRITSTPAGATVVLDGKDVGVTPLLINPISFGRHTIEVKKDGYVSSTQNFDIFSNNGKHIPVTLQRKTVEMLKAEAEAARAEEQAKAEAAAQAAQIATRKPVTTQKPAVKPAAKPGVRSTALTESLLSDNGVYADFIYRAVDASAVGFGIGGYYARFNVEANVLFGVKAVDIDWSRKEDPAYQLVGDDYNGAVSYKPLIVGAKLGYAFDFGSRFRVTPQAGLSLLTTKTELLSEATNEGVEKGYKFGDNFHSMSVTFDARLYYAVIRNFGVYVTPGFAARVSKCDVYHELIEASSDLDSWGKGFNLQVGCSVVF